MSETTATGEPLHPQQGPQATQQKPKKTQKQPSAFEQLLSKSAIAELKKLPKDSGTLAVDTLEVRQGIVEEGICIVLTDLDGQDGKVDGKIDKGMLLEWIKKLSKSNPLFADEIQKIVAVIPTEMIDNKRIILTGEASTALHGLLDPVVKSVFQQQDRNHDGFVNAEDQKFLTSPATKKGVGGRSAG